MDGIPLGRTQARCPAILSETQIFLKFSKISRRRTAFSVGNRQNPSANAKILGKSPSASGNHQNPPANGKILGKTPISFGKRQNPRENAKILGKTAKSSGKRQNLREI